MNIFPCSEAGSGTIRDRMSDNVTTLHVHYVLQALRRLLLNIVKGELVFVSPGCISHVFKRGFSSTVSGLCNFRHAIFKKVRHIEIIALFIFPPFVDDEMKAK